MSKKQEITKKEMLAYLKDVRGINEVEVTATGLFLTVESKIEGGILYVGNGDFRSASLVFTHIKTKTNEIVFFLPEWNFSLFQMSREVIKTLREIQKDN